MSLSLLTPPAEGPVSLEEAKTHLRVEHDREDAYIASAIHAATSHAQAFTRRQFVSATWLLGLDHFPAREIRLPLPPLKSVEITYVDPSSSTRTWDPAEYVVDAPAGEHASRGRVVPVPGHSFPRTHAVANAVAVQLLAGYGAAADVPAAIKHAILLTVGDLFDNRAASTMGHVVSSLPLTAERLLWPYRAF